MTEFVTAGEGSEDVLVPASHEAVDHTAGPLSLLDATAHDAVDHTSLSVPLMSTADHSTLDHGAIPATNVGEDNPGQVSPAERTLGTEGNLRSFSPFDVSTMVGVHGGRVVQQVRASKSALQSIVNRPFPLNDNIPLISAGDEVIVSPSITPTSLSNTLMVEFTTTYGNNGAGDVVISLFRDSITNAIAAGGSYLHNNNSQQTAVLRHYLTVPTLSAQTYSIRMGLAVWTIYINGQGGLRRWGGVSSTVLTVTEYEA
jgi:hypothetical protein